MRIAFKNIINEAAAGLNQLPKDCFIAIKPESMSIPTFQIYYSDARGNQYRVNNQYLGFLSMVRGSALKPDPRLQAHKVWEVNQSYAVKGYGPLLYDIAMELANKVENGGGLLKADPEFSSDDAQNVWNYYNNSRADVAKIQLDSPENELTPDNRDNVRQDAAKKQYGRNWVGSPISKGYGKKIQLLNSPKILWLNNESQNPTNKYEFDLNERPGEDLKQKLKFIIYNNKQNYLFMRFTNRHDRELEINPNYGFNTPKGIYAYPFNETWIQHIINKTIPFAFESKGIQIFAWNPLWSNKKTIIINNNGEAVGYSKADYAKDIRILEEYFYNNHITNDEPHDLRNSPYPDPQDEFDQLLNKAKQEKYKKTYFNTIFYLARLLAEEDAEKWSFILKDVLNISCVFDAKNSATIHGNEPTQAVFFEPNKCKLLLNTENLFPKYDFNNNHNTKYIILKKQWVKISQNSDNAPYEITVYRIKHKKSNFLGGFIEKESNLSIKGTCWIDNAAVVYEDAVISDNAKIIDGARVFGNAQISGNALVADFVKIYGNAKVMDNSKVINDANVFDYALIEHKSVIKDNAKISGDAKISGNATISKNAQVNQQAIVRDNAFVTDDAIISGNAFIGGNAVIFSNAKISNYAYISGKTKVGTNAIIDAYIDINDDILIENVTITNESEYQLYKKNYFNKKGIQNNNNEKNKI